MTFQEFWPLYLRAHRLPGTRGLHYFATAFGIMAAIEAVVTERPLVFVLGIAVSYAIAISAHWFVERNQPLIKVSALWGAIADLRMCWLAATGRLAAEYALHGIAQRSQDGNARSGRTPAPSGRYLRYALLVGSGMALAAGLSDLSDLAHPDGHLIHPVMQLGAPIIAFAGALIAAFAAQRASHAMFGTAKSNAAGATAMSVTGPLPDLSSAVETSLRRACLALLAFGLLAFGLTELAEEGLPERIDLVVAVGAVAALLGIGVAVIRGEQRIFQDGNIGNASSRRAMAEFGPKTRGLRVDGRVHLVDTMEALLSAGHRQAVLKATLDSAAPQPSETLVDIGCGTGELAMMAALAVRAGSFPGAGEAVGLDATPGMIEIARRRAYQAGSAARFEVGVAEALPLPDESAQVVTSSFFFHHLPSDVKAEALREMWRVLAPGGRLVITDYGWARGFLGLIASFPMRFNFHEYVRGQLNGELERLIERERLGDPQTMRVFLGYIRVMRLIKPPRGDAAPSSNPRPAC